MPRLAVVIGRRGDDDILRLPIGGGAVRRGAKVERFIAQVFLDLLIDQRRFAAVDLLYTPRRDVYRRHAVVLRQQDRVGQPHIPDPGYCYFHIFASFVYHISK